MASIDYIMFLVLGDLTAGALLLVTCLYFTAINGVPGCMLTKPLEPFKGMPILLVWFCGGISHSH